MLICDGHCFIRGLGEHLFAQLYNWAMCREPRTKLGMNWEERILRLHWMVHAVNSISSTSATSSTSQMVHGVIFPDSAHQNQLPFPCGACGACGAQEAFPLYGSGPNGEQWDHHSTP